MLRFRFRLVQLFFCLGFMAVLTRLGYLQLWCHAELSKRAENQSERWAREAPRRGPILDREDRPLTVSARVASCYADPRMIRNPDRIAWLLAPALRMSPQDIQQKIRRKDGSFVWLKRFLSVEEAQKVEKLNLLGVGLKWEYKRAYPNGNLAAGLLGFVGTEGQGLSGVERMFDKALIDKRPARMFFRDGRGAGVVGAPMSEEKKDRAWVKLSLDQTIQYIAERELEWGMERSRARSGFIIVQDPNSGEILAMANRPTVSVRDAKVPQTSDLLIPPVHWVFEPGSTMKVVTAAAALEEKVVRVTETFDCEGGDWKYADIRIHDHEPETLLTFAQVIERSSNIGTAKVGLRLGRAKLHDYLRAFGFGSRSGCELPGEGAGLLKPLNKWSGVSLPVISFGQEVGVTGIQLACAYSAIANGGKLLEPRIFREVVSADGERREWGTPSVVRQVVTPEVTRAVTKMMEGVVTRGTGQAAKLDGWRVAGKTGTAQKIDPRTKRYSPDKFIASFCGFAPASKPRLTIIVVFDEPRGVTWGGYNAGPVFRNVAWHALTYLDVPADNTAELALAKKGASTF